MKKVSIVRCPKGCPKECPIECLKGNTPLSPKYE